MMAQADLLEATDPQAATELRTQAQEMYGNWKEGGAYRVLAHTIVGGLSGDWSGAAGAGSSALIAGQLDDLTADLPPGVREAVGAGVSAGLGYLTGGEQGASTAFNQDTNNRQLHVDEIDWIKRHAQEFANQQGISEEEATSILARQALMQIDWVWYEKFGGKDAYNTQAAAFLSGAGTLSEGDAIQQMFTATGDQYTRPYLFAEDVRNSDNLSFYEQYVIRDSDKSTSQVMLENEWRGLTGLPQGLWDKWSAYQGEREGVAWLLSGPTFLFDTLYMDAIGKPFANAVENPQVIAEQIQAGAEGIKAIGGELTPGQSLLSQIYGDNTVLLSSNLAVADAALPVAGVIGVGKAGQLVGKELLSSTGSRTVRPGVSSESSPFLSNTGNAAGQSVESATKPGVGAGVTTPNIPLVSAPGLSQDLRNTLGSIRNGGDNWFDSTLKTSAGDINIAAEIKVNGTTLELSEFSVYGASGDVSRGTLMREMLASRAQLMQVARENGFTELRITGHRVANSSSAYPGKEIDWVIPLK